MYSQHRLKKAGALLIVFTKLIPAGSPDVFAKSASRSQPKRYHSDLEEAGQPVGICYSDPKWMRYVCTSYINTWHYTFATQINFRFEVVFQTILLIFPCGLLREKLTADVDSYFWHQLQLWIRCQLGFSKCRQKCLQKLSKARKHVSNVVCSSFAVCQKSSVTWNLVSKWTMTCKHGQRHKLHTK